jgi:hypothetical protein
MDKQILYWKGKCKRGRWTGVKIRGLRRNFFILGKYGIVYL